jgi:hypothetical protein
MDCKGVVTPSGTSSCWEPVSVGILLTTQDAEGNRTSLEMTWSCDKHMPHHIRRMLHDGARFPSPSVRVFPEEADGKF